MSRNLVIAAIAFATLGVAQAAVAAPNLVINGSFENRDGLGLANAEGNYNLPQFTTFAGWTVMGSSDGVTLFGPTNSQGIAASDGDWSMDLTPLSLNSNGFGGISQTIATVIGRSYRLTFDIGNSPAFNGQTAAVISGGVGSNFPDWSYDGGGRTGNAWDTVTYDFVATAATTELIFGGGPATGVNNSYVGLDNVSVVALGVPEPKTWGLMLLGFGALGGAIRRSRLGQTAAA